MKSSEIRQKYLKFFEDKGHSIISPAPLVLEDDPTTLFTSSGMQPLVPYLMGETHPEGKRLVDSQPSFRSGDIEEVGDNRHTTFFEMLGNWSLGDYFKKEQLEYFWEFLTKELNLDPEKLYVSVFEGNEFVEKDLESIEIWKSLGVLEDHIFEYGVEKNWWSRSGTPDKMPVGEIGGPDSEVFYEFSEIEHDESFGEKCHPNCDCGRFLEIGNSVFIQYKKVGDGEFEELPQKNVDFGGGLERITAATLDNPDIFEIDLFEPVIKRIEEISKKEYKDNSKEMRIIADHLRAAFFLIGNKVVPSKEGQGSVLRRLIRQAVFSAKELGIGHSIISYFAEPFKEVYKESYPEITKRIDKIMMEFSEEEKKYRAEVLSEKSLNKIKTMQSKDYLKVNSLLNPINASAVTAFNSLATLGVPPEISLEYAKNAGTVLTTEQENDWWQNFDKAKDEHRAVSRAGAEKKFAGGLAGHSETEIKYHTTTHLLHQALRDVLGPEVFQKGSNITPERLRFDFSYDKKMTDEEIKKVEEIINERIKEDLQVDRKFMSVDEAKRLNAIGLFTDKYEKEVSIYAIGPGFGKDESSKDTRARGGYYSMEFCGGPHVEHTGQIGGVKLVKEEAVSAGVRRIRAVLV